MCLKGLSQPFKDGTLELRKLIQKEYTMMSKRNLTRLRDRTTPDQGGCGNRMVGGSERTGPYQRLSGTKLTRNGVNLSRFQRFINLQWRQDCWEQTCEHTFARTRGTNHQDIMPARSGDFQCSFYGLLSFDIRKVHFIKNVLLPRVKRCVARGKHRTNFRGRIEKPHRISKTVHPIYGNTFNDSGLCTIGRRHNNRFKTISFSQQCHG